MSMPVFGASCDYFGGNRRRRKRLIVGGLSRPQRVYSSFSTHNSQECDESCGALFSMEPRKGLDQSVFLPHFRSIQMSDLVAYVDGGSLGSPGSAGIGVVIDDPGGETIRIAKWVGHQDNNVAEYLALLEALQCAVSLNAKAIHVYSDSQVVVRQMTGEYNCRSPRLYSLHWICRKLTRSLAFSISHVRREQNREANQLASNAARQQAG
jgi:ribonuclease HI